MKKILCLLLVSIQPLVGDLNISTSQNSSNGDSVSAWENFDGIGNTIMASIQESGTWNAAVAIASYLTYPVLPRTDINTTNQKVVIWKGYDTVTFAQSLFGSFYDDMGGVWTTSLISDPALEYVIGDHEVKIANNGVTVVTWSSYMFADGSYQARGIYAPTYGTWTAPATLP